MSFDPDKVEKYNAMVEIVPSHGVSAEKVVLGEDYDHLLEMFQEQRKELVRIGEVHGFGPYVPKDFMEKGLARVLEQVRRGEGILFPLPALGDKQEGSKKRKK